MPLLRLPPNPRDVRKEVEPQHLVPHAPRAAWDGWFAIAILPRGCDVRWIKAHFYHSACRQGSTPFAAVEGFGGKTEAMVCWGGPAGVSVFRKELGDDAAPSGTRFPLRVECPGLFRLDGASPRYEMRFSLPGEPVRARFEFEVGWPIWWSRWGRLLTYAGQHASVRTALVRRGAGEDEVREGLGVMEHVSGAALPFDFTRRLPFHYHWDVLAFHTPGSPADAAAGLSFGRGGETWIALRAAARLPGRAPEPMQGLRVRYLQTSLVQDEQGREVMVPLRWEGSMRSASGRFRYEAVSATPLATILPGGGMIGFDFQGEWTSAASGPRSWEGTGFCEIGDFSGGLAARARGRVPLRPA